MQCSYPTKMGPEAMSYVLQTVGTVAAMVYPWREKTFEPFAALKVELSLRRWRCHMKQHCAEISINSELVNLKQVQANLEALLASRNGGFAEHSRVVEALSFVQQAGLALSGTFGALDSQNERNSSRFE